MKRKIETLTSEIPASPWFDPHKSFLNLSIVRWMLVVAVGFAFMAWAAIYIKNATPFDFSERGFDCFIQRFKFPLSWLAASIPLLALLAANHRSEQTKAQMSLTTEQISRTEKQIEIAEDQNRFSNHFKHLEEFIKAYGDESSALEGLHLTSARRSHHEFFPKSRHGSFRLDDDIIIFFKNSLYDFEELAYGLAKNEDHDNRLRRMSILMREFVDFFKIHSEVETNLTIRNPPSAYSLQGRSVQAAVRWYIDTFLLIDSVLAFDDKWDRPAALVALAEFEPQAGGDGIGASHDIRRVRL